MVSREKHYYNILGVERDADDKTLKKAYRDAALMHHPDKGGSDEAFQKVNEAWQVLSDSTKRAQYDQVSVETENLEFFNTAWQCRQNIAIQIHT